MTDDTLIALYEREKILQKKLDKVMSEYIMVQNWKKESGYYLDASERATVSHIENGHGRENNWYHTLTAGRAEYFASKEALKEVTLEYIHVSDDLKIVRDKIIEHISKSQ